jgi:hypothetical protein
MCHTGISKQSAPKTQQLYVGIPASFFAFSAFFLSALALAAADALN